MNNDGGNAVNKTEDGMPSSEETEGITEQGDKMAVGGETQNQDKTEKLRKAREDFVKMEAAAAAADSLSLAHVLCEVREKSPVQDVTSLSRRFPFSL